MITISLHYDGHQRCSLTHPEGHRLATDTPRELGGEAAAFSPTDLIAAGLVSCIVTTIALWSERHGLDLTGMRADVVKEMASPPRRLGRLAVTLTLPSDRVPQALRARLEEIGHRCPVHASLHPEVDAPIFYQYR